MSDTLSHNTESNSLKWKYAKYNKFHDLFRVEPEGRIHRLDFFTRIFFLWLLLLVIRGVVSFSRGESDMTLEIEALIGWVVFVFVFFCLRAQVLKRIRDIGYGVGIVHVFLWILFALYAVTWLSALLMLWDSAVAYEIISLMRNYQWIFSIVNIIFGALMLCLCLIPGQKWDNAFGSDPKK